MKSDGSSRKQMKNSFNTLLVALAVFDSTYLLGAILLAFQNRFDLATEVLVKLFPHLLFPLHQTAICGSIFMTVAISWERYIATHHPLDYNQVWSLPESIVPSIFFTTSSGFKSCVNLLCFKDASNVFSIQSWGGKALSNSHPQEL